MNKNTTKILNDLKISIDEAVRHREIWWELGFSQNRKEFKAEFDSQEYNYYLHASYEAHSLSMFLALGKIFDPDSRSSSIRALKANLAENGRKDISLLISETLKPFEINVQKILDVRSKIIAHTDTNYTEQSVLKSNSLSPNDIKDLILNVRETYYMVLQRLLLNTKQHPDGAFSESTLHVLRKLKT
ncbi:hypothetical protein [Vibrio breoganii]|uniref:AbiU2 domain-containing protein n=1 Tax=Vibrio breoganii TaxID=553239 RepID=UPI000C85BBBF|nr:hypothetical protein [Vibrio breoganii]PMI13706.1 hypothetical protein BCU49_16880 [Vibrio breoganii]PML42312.1 hypothetical protein BCT77_18250 [Vibrio breoganii]PMO70207.1 hypothetical protein BCT02_17740 [Vibrio breoganii]PMO89278.1 hypothetical protein BCS99_05340 [Vibrio breoganii]